MQVYQTIFDFLWERGELRGSKNKLRNKKEVENMWFVGNMKKEKLVGWKVEG